MKRRAVRPHARRLTAAEGYRFAALSDIGDCSRTTTRASPPKNASRTVMTRRRRATSHDPFPRRARTTGADLGDDDAFKVGFLPPVPAVVPHRPPASRPARREARNLLHLRAGFTPKMQSSLPLPRLGVKGVC